MAATTYLFDFDGTLVDSMPHWSRKMLRILEKNRVDYPDNIIETITPLGDMGTVAYFQQVLGIPWSIEKMLAEMDAYALPKYRDEIELKDGVFDFLTRAHERGIRLNVLTASPHRMLDPCLKRNGVWDLFDRVWSCDDFRLTKSDPQIYLNAARQLEVEPSEILFFDDNWIAVETAAKTGLQTVGVFDPSGAGFCAQLKSVCDQYIETFSDWTPWE